MRAIIRLIIAFVVLVSSYASLVAQISGPSSGIQGNVNQFQKWSTSTRPPHPTIGMFGYNTDTNTAEFYTGSTFGWKSVGHGSQEFTVTDFGCQNVFTAPDQSTCINNVIAFAHTMVTALPALAPVKILFPPGHYPLNDSINMTGWSQNVGGGGSNNGPAVTLEGYGAYLFATNTFAACHPVLDALGSGNLSINGINIWANNGNPLHEPSTGIQLGRTIQNLGAPNMRLTNVSIDGFYSVAAFYAFADEQSTYMNVWAVNRDTNQSPCSPWTAMGRSYSCVLDGNNHFNVTSQFTTETIPVGQHNSYIAAHFIQGNCTTTGGSTSVSMWISGDVEQLVLHNTYLNTAGTHCFEIGIDSAASMYLANWDLKAHCEDGTLVNTFLIRSSVGAPVFRSFMYRDSALFADAGGGGVGALFATETGNSFLTAATQATGGSGCLSGGTGNVNLTVQGGTGFAAVLSGHVTSGVLDAGSLNLFPAAGYYSVTPGATPSLTDGTCTVQPTINATYSSTVNPQFQDMNVSIERFVTSTAKVFDSPSLYTATGKFYSSTSTQWNRPSSWAGCTYLAGAEDCTAAVSLVSGLPTCSATYQGDRRFVTDSNSTTYHATAAGNGSNKVQVVCDGTNWYVD